MISCGEPSGDLYAGALATELRARAPGITITGLGGPRLRAAGASLIGDFNGMTVTGLVEALRVVPHSYAAYRRLVAAARADRPDVFVAVDFPDFNFRVMRAMHGIGVPIVYYVSPQLWAWRPGRMETMRRFVDTVLVIFPFESEIYEKAGVSVEFVGHPLVDVADAHESRDQLLRGHGLDPAAPTVALLPGSRPNELQRIAPTMAASLPLIAAQVPAVQFVVAVAPGLPERLFEPLVHAAAAAPSRTPRPVVLVHNRTDDVLAASDIVITASGTATVQTALHERPMVVVYRLSPLTYTLGRRFVSVNMYAMANLVAGRRIVPELIQDNFTPQSVAAESIRLLTDRTAYASMQHALRDVRRRLGEPGASGRAAQAILEIAGRSARGATPA
jgi:lipid-A-disaccharide synthase